VDFSEQVKQIRKQARLSQMAFADELSVSFSTVNRLKGNIKNVKNYLGSTKR
jgi:transcriptional regulator with XRE-family HTH domain